MEEEPGAPPAPRSWAHDPLPATRLTGAEQLTPDGGTVQDLWSWSFSDLRANVARGIVAEYLVARAVGADLSRPRLDFDNYDVLAPDGTTIEVKAAAYLQAWRQERLSTIRWGGLRAGTWDETARTWGSTADARAEVYVLALQIETDPALLDPMDLAQWRFFVLPNRLVRDLGVSVGLTTVQRLTAAVEWADLSTSIRECR